MMITVTTTTCYTSLTNKAPFLTLNSTSERTTNECTDVPHPRKRLTAEEMLRHPWITARPSAGEEAPELRAAASAAPEPAAAAARNEAGSTGAGAARTAAAENADFARDLAPAAAEEADATEDGAQDVHHVRSVAQPQQQQPSARKERSTSLAGRLGKTGRSFGKWFRRNILGGKSSGKKK